MPLFLPTPRHSFRSQVARLAFPIIGLLWLTGIATSSCTSIYHSRRSILELDQTFVVNKNQTLYYAPTAKSELKRSKQLIRPIKAALYLQDDTLFVEPIKAALPHNDGNPATMDVSDSAIVFFVNPRPRQLPVNETSPWFRYHFTSFDADVVTIPFKYRPRLPGGLPPQLVTNANAAGYVGLRYDQGYQRNVFYHHQQRSETRSFSLGAGGLIGLSANTIGPFSTDNQVSAEYDGACLSYGLAVIFGYRSITLGLATGQDYLMDKNGPLWVYQNKPWLGVTVGLNLN